MDKPFSIRGRAVIFSAGAAFGLTRFVRTMLYGLQPTDPTTFIAAALLLLLIAIAAGRGPSPPRLPHRSHPGLAPRVIAATVIEISVKTLGMSRAQ